MPSIYETWMERTEVAIRREILQVQDVMDAIKGYRASWAIPNDIMDSPTTPDRMAARADAIHRSYQALVAAELDAEALVRSLRSVISRLDRGERPFILDDDSIYSNLPIGPI